MNKALLLVLMAHVVVRVQAAVEKFDRPNTPAQTSGSNPNQIGSQWTIANGAWSISNRQLVQAGQLNTSEQLIVWNGGGTSNSIPGVGFTLQATVQLNLANKQNSGVWMGLLFHYQNPANYYAFRFTDSGWLQFLKVSGGNGVALMNANPAFAFVKNRPYVLTITSTNAGRFSAGVFDTVTGTTVYTNANLVDGSSRHSNGYGGLYSNAGYGVQAYDNFSLVGLPEVSTRPRLSAQRVDDGLLLSWTGDAALQSAGRIAGPWDEIPDAASPFTTGRSSEFRFFRLFQPETPRLSSICVATNGSDVTGTGTLASPFATLERARQAVATANHDMTSDIVVHVRGGTYPLSATLRLDVNDSGFNGHQVLYRAYTNETPVLSGGVRVTQWTARGDGTYTAPVGSQRFRQLYVNGRRAIRARTPDAGSFARLISWNSVGRSITVASNDVVSLGNPDGVEMVITRNFNQNRLRVASVTPAGRTATLTFKSPESARAFDSAYPVKLPNQAYFFENSLSFLDSPDEWFLEAATGTLYYRPPPGESMTDANVVVPGLETLVALQGNSVSDPVRNVVFEGITFAHTAWNAVDQSGYVGNQAGSAVGGAEMSSGVFVDTAEFLRFSNNFFVHLGGQGLTLHSACHSNTIAGNFLRDISGNGISLDRVTSMFPSDRRMSTYDIQVTNNVVQECAIEYWGSVGIFAGFVANTVIAHNEVAWLPYTGISVGWGWTADLNPARTNTIEWNHVHHVMNLLEDGAGIYTLSKQPGTRIEHNYLHDIRRSSWSRVSLVAGIYLDQGTSLVSVSNNVILPTEVRVNQNFSVSPVATNNFVGDNDALLAEVIDNAGPQGIPLPPAIGPALVGYWKLDNAAASVVDSSGRGNHGTLLGSATSIVGICGNALHFDGDTRIVVPDSPSLRLQRFTVCVWARPDAGVGTMREPDLVSKQDAAAGTGFLLGGGPAGSDSLALRIRNGATDFQASYPERSAGSWIHVAAIHDGTSLRVYRNGKLSTVLDFEDETVLAHDGTTLSIGAHFAGALDEVRVYDGALSEADLQTLVDMKMEPSLVARWPMDDGNAYFFLGDLSGHANFGNEYLQYNYATSPASARWLTQLAGPGPWHSRSNQFYLSFERGNNPGIMVKDDPALRLTNFTISAWIYPTVTLGAMAHPLPSLVSKRNGSTGYALGATVSDGNTLSSRILDGKTFVDSSYSETAQGRWIHVVSTYDGEVNRIYRNGILQSAVVAGSDRIRNDGSGLVLGQGFEGCLRDVRIYRRALSESEIQWLEP